MNVLVVDASGKRRDRIVKALESRKHTVTSCVLSNDFIDAVERQAVDKVLLDLETWRQGRSIYTYLGLPKKLEKTPILFYGAPEGFSVLGDREANEADRVFPETLDIESLINSVQQEI